MQKRLTWWLTGAALGLFVLIYFLERKLPSTAERAKPAKAFPQFATNQIVALEIQPGTSSNQIRIEATNGLWSLTVPPYPVQQTPVETFINALTNLHRYDRISPHDVLIQGQKVFGFDPPYARVAVEFQNGRLSFVVGGITPLTNHVYLREEGSGMVYVTDGTIRDLIPANADEWRSRAIVQLDHLPFTQIQLRSGQRVLEVEKDQTNGLWRISRPVPARADQDRVAALLQTLRLAEVAGFVTDEPSVDLEKYGLQAPEIELAFLQGTNRLYSIQFGASPTNRSELVYGRLMGRTNIVLISRGISEYLKQPYKNFLDPRLITMHPAALDRVVVHATEDFELQRSGTNWMIGKGREVQADPALTRLFFTNVLNLEIVDVAREVPTEADFAEFGFVNPVATYSFYEKLTNTAGIATNIHYSEITFGNDRTDIIFARRADEAQIYMVPLAQMLTLPRQAYQLRDLNVWSFASSNAVALEMITSNTTNSLNARSPNVWSADPIAQAAIEEMVYRLGNLRGIQWVTKDASKLPLFGITNESPRLRVHLATPPDVLELQFGKRTPAGNVYAAIRLPGEEQRVVFEFPGGMFQQILELLSLSPGNP